MTMTVDNPRATFARRLASLVTSAPRTRIVEPSIPITPPAPMPVPLTHQTFTLAGTHREDILKVARAAGWHVRQMRMSHEFIANVQTVDGARTYMVSVRYSHGYVVSAAAYVDGERWSTVPAALADKSGPVISMLRSLTQS